MSQEKKYSIDWVSLIIIVAILFVLFWAVFVNAAYADTLVLCKPARGSALRVRTMCTKSEVQLDPVALGLQGPAGPQGQKGDKGDAGVQGVQGPAGSDAEVLHLFDANGQDLGVLVKLDGASWTTYLPTLDVFSTFLVHTGNLDTARHNFHYVDAGCTGTPYIENSSGVEDVTTTTELLRLPVDDTSFFRIARDEVPAFRFVSSQSDGMYCTPDPRSITSVSLEEVTLPFVLPVATPLHIGFAP